MLVNIWAMKTVSAGKRLFINCLKVYKLVEECTENIDEAKIAEMTLTENIHKCSSCTCTLCCFQ